MTLDLHPKGAVAEALLSFSGIVTVYVHADGLDVVLPTDVLQAAREQRDKLLVANPTLHAAPMVQLDVGLDMKTPIPDLDATGDALTGTLHFGTGWFEVSIPWAAVIGYDAGDTRVRFHDVKVVPNEPETPPTLIKPVTALRLV